VTVVRFHPPSSPGFVAHAGAEHGLRRLLLASGRLPLGDVGAPHTHGGDELIRVLSGRLRMRVGERRYACGPGDVVVVPPGIEHGFVVEDEAVVEVVAEQDMGSTYAVVEQDGSVREIEVHRPGVPWDRPPAPGAAPTSAEQMAAITERVRPV
jgi:mannose-6-phosphate isomerase-like protein (cupin superfamily)